MLNRFDIRSVTDVHKGKGRHAGSGADTQVRPYSKIVSCQPDPSNPRYIRV